MTDQSPQPDRLDRVERILEAIASNQLQERDRRLEFREDLEILYDRQQLTQAQLDAFAAQVNAYVVQSNATLLQLSAGLSEEAQARAEFRQQMVGLQTEVRNILRELAAMRRPGNGTDA